jgi:GTP-binding protein LepA
MVTPTSYFGPMVDIIKERRGLEITSTYLDDGQVLLQSVVPWQEVVCDMHDQVKHNSAGFASFNYEDAGYQLSDLVKVEICVNGDPCDALSFICHREKATGSGRKLATKLKEVLSRQQFEIVIQAKIGSKVSVIDISRFKRSVIIGDLNFVLDISKRKNCSISKGTSLQSIYL